MLIVDSCGPYTDFYRAHRFVIYFHSRLNGLVVRRRVTSSFRSRMFIFIARRLLHAKNAKNFPTPSPFGENLFLEEIEGVREGDRASEGGRRKIPCPTHKRISERRFSTSFHPNSFGVNISHPHTRPFSPLIQILFALVVSRRKGKQIFHFLLCRFLLNLFSLFFQFSFSSDARISYLDYYGWPWLCWYFAVEFFRAPLEAITNNFSVFISLESFFGFARRTLETLFVFRQSLLSSRKLLQSFIVRWKNH